MNTYVTGDTIRALREKKQLTQRALAERLCVSDKTISKWETGRGLPDVVMLAPLAEALSISVAELLSGACVVNQNRAGNLHKSCFYACPVCGNLIWAAGEGAFSCCGVSLPPLEAEDGEGAHEIHVETVENEWYVTLVHPMEKEHYIPFLALVSGDRAQIVRLYPEQDACARFARSGRGVIYAYCNRHGLFRLPTPAIERKKSAR